ncbi:MAG TPA: sigma-70 family RNA polymerase sigma factor [Patescibacteria group bacterium]|nr:sigma-70 family RNA polymerase sigma factor [Patescibacteria group bacterium]
MDTNELARLAKAGDAAAFGQLYDQFAQKIYKYIRMKVTDAREAEDLLQEVFLKAHKGLYGLRLENLNFSAWLYKIAGNAVNDYFRKKYRSPETSPLDETFDVADKTSLLREAELASDAERLRGLLALLPDNYRQVLELRFLQDLSLDEVAAIMGKTNLSIRLLQHRALRKVQVLAKKNGYVI